MGHHWALYTRLMFLTSQLGYMNNFNVGTPNVHCSTYSNDPKSRDVRPMFYGSLCHQLGKMKKVKEQVIMAKKSRAYVEQYLSSDRTKNALNSLYEEGKDESTTFDFFTIKDSMNQS